MSARIRILGRAQRDLDQIYDYVLRETPPRADRFIEELVDAIASLETLPERGAVPRDQVLRQRGYRYLVHKPYLVFYKLVKQQVRVYRVLHGRRAYHGLL